MLIVDRATVKERHNWQELLFALWELHKSIGLLFGEIVIKKRPTLQELRTEQLSQPQHSRAVAI
jgi:hypothetical protein